MTSSLYPPNKIQWQMHYHAYPCHPYDEVFQVEEKRLDSPPITSKEIRSTTRVDPILSRVLQFLKFGWPTSVADERLKPYFSRKYELMVEQDCILWGLRVIIPKCYQTHILEELHLSHPGIV